MTRVEFLLEIKESLTNQLSCISDSLVTNTPNERFRDEWKRVQERLKVLNEILKDEKQKNLPEKIEDKIECRKFDFIDETFGEEVKNTLLFNSNSFVIISLFDGEIFIRKYKDILNLLKEFISNRNELLFLRDLIEDQQREINLQTGEEEPKGVKTIDEYMWEKLTNELEEDEGELE